MLDQNAPAPKVKVCGMTRSEDVRAAVELGVDAIGMILAADSPRLIDIKTAKEITAHMPSDVKLVGVFVDASADYILECIESIGLDIVQLHGDESAQFCDSLKHPYVKAIRAKSAEQVSLAIETFSTACAILLDPYVAGQHGGTGKQLDLSLWPQGSNHKMILAGGLSAQNVSAAVARTSPYAVDLNSGVETRPGIKDSSLIAQALNALIIE